MEKGFTLIIPLYNKKYCIRQTLDSVLNNHGSYPFKCIIVDDDSTDGSSEIALEYDRNYPDVFQYIKRTHHGNKTSVYAKNLGIKVAETNYIGFLDADDELCPGFIDRGCTFLDEHPEYSLYGNGFIYHRIDENGHEISWNCNYEINGVLNFPTSLIGNNFGITFCSHIYRTELVKQILFINTYHEGLVFKFRYIYNYPNVYIDNSTCESIIYNEQNSESYSTWEIQQDNTHIFEKVFNELKQNISNFTYDYRIDEDGKLWFWEI